MTTFLAIMTREVRERSRLFLMAAALAVLPFVAGMLPSAQSDRPGIINTTSSYLALTLALGSAIVLGASTIMRDLVERRLSFYFSKPVHVDAIWFGKAAGSLVASVACFVIIAAPAALFVRGWPGPGMWMFSAPQLIGLTLIGVVALFFFSHLLASVTRSRSVLIGLDFVLAAIAALVLFALVRPLLLGAAIDLLRNIAIAVGIALLLIAALAPTWQLANGRTDIKRAHKALSKFLWPAIYVVLIAVSLYVVWVTRAKPADLIRVQYMRQAPRGETVVVAGAMRGRGDYHGTFLMEGNGGYQRVPQSPWTEVEFSRDGRVRAWYEAVGFMPGREFELHTSRGPSGIRVRGYGPATTLSDDGSRVAIGRGNLVSVHEIATGRLLASAGGFDSGRQHRIFFVSNDVVRIIELSFGSRPTPMRVFELDVPRKKLIKTGEITVPSSGFVAATPDGSRLLLRKLRRVVDGRTLATIAELPPYEPTSSTILSDGRVADTVREGNRARLRIHGGPEVVLPVPHASVVGELADGTLIVRGTQRVGWSATGAERTMFLVDPASGAIKLTVPQVKGPELVWADPRLVRYDTTRLAGVDREGKIVWWDVKTGRTQRTPR